MLGTAALKKVIISETTLLRFLVSLPHEHLVKHQPLIQKTLDENPFFLMVWAYFLKNEGEKNLVLSIF